MKVTLNSTEKIVHLNGVPARIWEGETESGVKVHAFVTRIACPDEEEATKEFEAELQEHAPPSPAIEAYPARMILN